MRLKNTQLWPTGSLAQCSGADARRHARAAAGAFRSVRGLRLTADTFVREVWISYGDSELLDIEYHGLSEIWTATTQGVTLAARNETVVGAAIFS